MEKEEYALQNSAALKNSADTIYYLNQKISKYKTNLSYSWKGNDFSSVEKEIDEVRKRLDRIVYELEDMSKEYLQYAQM